MRHQNAVDAVLHEQASSVAFQMHVAGANLDGVVDRRVHQFDDRVVVFSDRAQGDDRGHVLGARAHHLCVQTVDRPQLLLLLRQIGLNIVCMRDDRAHLMKPGYGQAAQRPILGDAVEGVGQNQAHAAVICRTAHEHALHTVGKADGVEAW